MMDGGTTINLFVNPKIITNRQKYDIPMNFLTNAWSKIVDYVGEIIGSGQTRFHPQMIANIPSLNEMTKTYRVTFNSGGGNTFKMRIGDNIVKFPDNQDRIYLSKRDKEIGQTEQKKYD